MGWGMGWGESLLIELLILVNRIKHSRVGLMLWRGFGIQLILFFFFPKSILEVGGEAGECPLLKPLVCAELSF